jgi:hypothetical protein
MVLTATVYGIYLAVFILSFLHHPAMQYPSSVCPPIIPAQTH